MEVLSSRVLLRVRDFDRSRRFYTETLGLRIYREFGSGGRVTGLVLFLGGGFLELGAAGPSARASGDDGGRVALWLQVPDVDEEHERLRARGVDVVEPPAMMPWGLREMWIADPDGVRLVIVEIPPDHPLRRRVG